MKSFKSLVVHKDAVLLQLDELEQFIKERDSLKERDEVLPFFKAREHLCAGLGLVNAHLAWPDRVASELQLFGDFACDAASGDATSKAFTLIEFEDAKPYSIFKAKPEGESTVRPWASRLEHGFSQLVDWGWRISEEGLSSRAFKGVFGIPKPNILLLLVIGRRSDLSQDDIDRLDWRSTNLTIGSFKMACWTYDDIIDNLRRRLLYGNLV